MIASERGRVRESPPDLTLSSPVIMMTKEEEAEFFNAELREEAMRKWGGIEPQVVRPNDGWHAIADTRVLVAAWSLRDLPLSVMAGRGGALEYLCLMVGSPKRAITLEHLRGGLTVTNWGDTVGPSVAEAALMMALAALRGLCKHEDELRRGIWSSVHSSTRTLLGKSVGIHGFGSVARALINLLRPFNTRISVFARDVPEALIRSTGARAVLSLEDLMAGSEVFFEAEALNVFTQDCLNYRMLSLLPLEAVLVNVARGGLIVEEDLLRAASERDLRVALDVYRQEPLPMNSPVRQIPGALLLPHMAGPTQDLRAHCGRLAVENVSAYLQGRHLQFVVDEARFALMT